MAVIFYNDYVPSYNQWTDFPNGGVVDILNKYASANRQMSDKTTFDFLPSSPTYSESSRWILYTSSVTPYTAGGVTIIGHNAPAGATYELRLSNSSWGGTDVYGTGRVPIDNSLLRPGQSQNIYIDLGANYSAKYWDLRIWSYRTQDGSGVLGSTVSTSHVTLGQRFETTCGLNYTESIQSVGGTNLAALGESSSWHTKTFRTAQLEFLATSDAELWGTSSDPDGCLLSMDQAIGNHGSITVLPYGNQTTAENTQKGIFGHIQNSSPARIRDLGGSGVLASKTISITEEK